MSVRARAEVGEAAATRRAKRHGRRRRAPVASGCALLAALWLTTWALGCVEDETRYPVVISVTTDDGKPLPGLPVTLGKTLAGKSGPDGKLKLRVRGKEGARLTVSVPTPQGYKPAAPSTVLVLRRLTDLDGSGTRALAVEQSVQFVPLQRQYAVLVRAGVPGIPVETFGTQRAVTNARGVAMFLYEGSPGDELRVKLDTEGHPELKPQNPQQSFLLAPRSEAYLVKEHFVVTAPKRGPHKPVHRGPTRL